MGSLKDHAVRILWCKANKLLPLHSGGDIRSYHIARQLASRHELTFLSYYDGVPDPAYQEELSRHFPGAISVCTGKPEGGWARALQYSLTIAGQSPFAVRRFASDQVQQLIQTCFQERRCDVAVCDFLDAAINFPDSLDLPCVLFQHNVESEIWRRHAATESNPAKKLMYKLEFEKMVRYEAATVRKFHQVIAVSEHDRELMSRWVDSEKIQVVPTGVDLREYRPDWNSPDPERVVTFVGAMDWEPNIDAVEYFCTDIWPRVLAEVPDAVFRIVGRNPDGRVQSFVSSSVQVTGRVPSVLEHLRQAAVVVVPLRIGGGTRLKIYEAMAAGKAVVATSVGAEGLDVHDGRDIMLQDDPAGFARSVVGLLKDRKTRLGYERAAAELAARYDWPAVARSFEKVLQQMLATEPLVSAM